MNPFTPGFTHTPVTPFGAGDKIDWKTYGKLIDFHVAQGAQALALPMHVGESVSLTDEEQREVLTFGVERTHRKIPVVAHVSDSGTSIAAERAVHAEKAGAAAVVITTPYYWTPPANMLVEHFETVGGAVGIPFYVWYAPDEMRGTKITTDLVLKLISSRRNFAGVVDSSNDWQFQINVLSNAQRARRDFQLVCGTEYMASAGANGATSMFTALAAIAPGLVHRLYEICRKEDYVEARPVQAQLAALYQVVKSAGFGGVKAALRALGRDCGDPRPPMRAVEPHARERLEAELRRLGVSEAEPRGW